MARVALNGDTRVGLPWSSLGAFMGIATNPRAFPDPLSPDAATQQVDEWLAAPRAADGDLAKGNYLAPAIFADARNNMRVCQEAFFGPVAMVMPFDEIGEAVDIANDSAKGWRGWCGQRISTPPTASPGR